MDRLVGLGWRRIRIGNARIAEPHALATAEAVEVRIASWAVDRKGGWGSLRCARRLDDELIGDCYAVGRARVTNHPATFSFGGTSAPSFQVRIIKSVSTGDKSLLYLPTVVLPIEPAELCVTYRTNGYLAVWLPSGQDNTRARRASFRRIAIHIAFRATYLDPRLVSWRWNGVPWQRRRRGWSGWQWRFL